MNMKFFGLLLLLSLTFILTGCTAVQNYSIRSYQGPPPLEDYRYVNPDAYGVPTAAR